MLCGLLENLYRKVQICSKILRSLPERFYPRVTSIEEHKDPDKMKVEDLVGSLQPFELKFETSKKKSIAQVLHTPSQNLKMNLMMRVMMIMKM